VTKAFTILCLVAAATLTHRGQTTAQPPAASASVDGLPRSGSAAPRTSPTGPGPQRPLSAAATVPPVPEPRPAADIPDTCTASFYGEAHRGLSTASGEPFDPDQLTAASWHHDFGTVLRVTAPTTGRSVEVVVNDRGPARRLDRCIDLARAAFERLTDLSAGLVEVTVTEVPA
jgi:rare lipoprotein A